MCSSIDFSSMHTISSNPWTLDTFTQNSLTGLAIFEVSCYMNPEELSLRAYRADDEPLEPMGTLKQRVVGGLCYLGLFVAALVEAVVRLTFSVIALVPTGIYSCLCEQDRAFEDKLLGKLSVRQFGICLQNLLDHAPRAISGLVQQAILDSQDASGRRTGYDALPFC